MRNLRYMAMIGLTFIAYKIQASEKRLSYDSINFNSEVPSPVKKRTEELTYNVALPTAQYTENTNEMKQFNQIVGYYIEARNKVEHPMQISHEEFIRGVGLKLEPSLLAAEQGMIHFSNVKFALLLSANFK